jgi:hypothetical protein
VDIRCRTKGQEIMVLLPRARGKLFFCIVNKITGRCIFPAFPDTSGTLKDMSLPGAPTKKARFQEGNGK